MTSAARYQSYQHILFTRQDKILTATLNRPEQRNASNPVLNGEILRMLQEVDLDDEINLLVLTGAGRAFSAGGDISRMLDSIDDIDGFVRSTTLGKRVLRAMLDLDKPIICRMNGDAIGHGATLALFCDIIIADEAARIGDPHVGIGLVAGDGGAIIWPQLIGFARAKQYLLSGDLLTAKEAAAIGLINFAVPAAELDTKVDAWAQKLSRGASKAIKSTKAVINIPLKQLLDSMIDAGYALETVTTRSKDHRAAIEAFAAKQKPTFTGE